MLKEIAYQEPVWEIAKLFPMQGVWSIEDYLDLDTRNGNRLIEYSNGTVEVLPMPSIHHQFIAGILYRLFATFVIQHDLGHVFFAPTKVKVRSTKVREPDILFVSHANYAARTEQWLLQIDLAVEIISPDDPNRDLETKRREYAQAGIPEYWIIDPRSQEVMVLTLDGSRYSVHGVFGIEEVATSVLLDGFQVSVDELFE